MVHNGYTLDNFGATMAHVGNVSAQFGDTNIIKNGDSNPKTKISWKNKKKAEMKSIIPAFESC
jgi:hypothetical protein